MTRARHGAVQGNFHEPSGSTQTNWFLCTLASRKHKLGFSYHPLLVFEPINSRKTFQRLHAIIGHLERTTKCE
jgi:hypothetical protein